MSYIFISSSLQTMSSINYGYSEDSFLLMFQIQNGGR